MNYKKWIGLLALPALLYLIALGLIYGLQHQYVFQAKSLPADYIFNFSQPFRESFMTTADNVRLNVLFFPTEKVKKGVVLYFHGNADNLQRWGRFAVDFTERGYDVMMPDYRGYGKSEGKAEEDLLFRDASLLYDSLQQRYSSEEIILYGRSLGSGVATRLASQVDARMLILETPFNNLPDVIRSKVPGFLTPFGFTYQFANDRYLKSVNYPILILHGTNDEVVPYHLAQALKSSLKPSDEFVTIPEGGHKNLRTFSAYREVMDRVLGINEFKSE